MGALGFVAVALGAAFLGFQKAAWIIFGTVYVLIGILYVAGKSGLIVRSIGWPDCRGAYRFGPGWY